MSQVVISTMEPQAGTPLTPARPSRNDPAIRPMVAKSLLKPVTEWLKEPDITPEGVMEAIEDALRHSMSRDGFDLANWLKDEYLWSADAQLVEILDGAQSEWSDAHRRMVKVWVAACNVQPKLALGAKIRLPMNLVAGSFTCVDTSPVDCEIVKIDQEQAQYYVNSPAAGHEDYDNPSYTGRPSAIILDYEKVEAAVQ